VYGLLKGVPTASPLTSAYWRKKTPVPASMDPDRDGCGLLWCSPVVPNTARDITTVTKLASGTLLGHGFEPQMSLSVSTERTSICIITISYDRHEPGEDERAFRCYETLTEQLLALGYPPYRLNVRSMSYSSGEDTYGSVLADIKHALDPNAILSPGRYEQRSCSRDESGAGPVAVVAR
jgi:4-cresol dehydrogenase (hydroxylating)